MKGYLDTVLPARFLCTVAHLAASILVIYNREDIIIASLNSQYTNSEYKTIEDSLLAATWLSIVFLGVILLSLMAGLSIFAPFISGFDTACHFTATILICWMIREAWTYYTMWYCWIFFALIPMLLEIVCFLRICCIKKVKY